MDLLAKLTSELPSAMKSRDLLRVSTLRMLISALRNKEIERKKSLEESEAFEVLGTEAKKRREAMDEFRRVGREELALKEEQEMKIVQEYLPAALAEDELRSLIQKAIQASGAQSPKDMGKVMGTLMPQVKGRADGRLVQSLVQEYLKPS